VSLDSFDMRRLRKRFPDLVERIHQVGEQRSS
jgi:predicted phage-related endonuclease